MLLTNKAGVFYKLPTEAGVNTNQSRQSAQGQFAAAGAFAEKNANNRFSGPWPAEPVG
ncbi:MULTISPECIES: hypothetical protein [Serratia]|uniref:hypothetical protein n=1 Tax=Serratia TaxID=613 RepID=UPI0012ECC299|nr:MULTISPECIES: hypothetical protein [Serratia]